jgi:hypothetical protein
MKQRKEYEQQLIEKAMKDEAFRKQLVMDPATAIETEFGIKIPETITINVLEENSHSFYVVLPAKKRETDDELTDVELEQVAGGYTTNITCFQDSWATCNDYICK